MADTKLGTAYTEIRADSTQLRQDLEDIKALLTNQLDIMRMNFERAGESMDRLGKTTQSSGKKIAKTFKESIESALSMERVISRLAFIGTVGVVYSLARSIKQFFDEGIQGAIKFQRQMSEVFTMLDEVDKIFKNELMIGVNRLSVAFGQSTETMSKGLYDILSASIPVKDALYVLEQAAEAAAAGMTQTAKSADAITSILNAYGLSAYAAGDVSDLLFTIVKRGKITFAELSQDIGKVISTAGLLNYPIEELGASIATMTRQGVKSNEAMVALNRLLMNFLKPSEEARKVAKDYGIELNANTIRVLGLSGVMEVFKNATEDEIAVLSGNVRAFKALATGLADTEGYLYDLAMMFNRAGREAEALNEVVGTVDFKMAKAREQFKLMERNIGSIFVPLLGALAEAWNNLGKTETPFQKIKATDEFKKFQDELNKMDINQAKTLFVQLEYRADAYASSIVNLQNELDELDKTKVEGLKGKIGAVDLVGLDEKIIQVRASLDKLNDEYTITTAKSDAVRVAILTLSAALENLSAAGKRAGTITITPRIDYTESRYMSSLEDYKKVILSSLKEKLKTIDAKIVLGEFDFIEGKKAWQDYINFIKDNFDEDMFIQARAAYKEWLDEIKKSTEVKFEVVDITKTGTFKSFQNHLENILDIMTDLQINATEKWKSIWKSFTDAVLMELNKILAKMILLAAFQFVISALGIAGSVAGVAAGTGAGAAGRTPGILGGGGAGGGFGGVRSYNPVFNPSFVNNINIRYTDRMLGEMVRRGTNFNRLVRV